MKLRKFELAVIVLTVMLVGVTFGYILGRVPAAGTFEISTTEIITRPTLPPSASPTSLPSPMPVEDEDSFDSMTPEPIVSGADPDELPETEIVEISPYTPKPLPKGKINVNTAGLDELTQLPGIGPAIGQRILDERENGAFISVEDLQRVSGIGEKTLEKLKEYVVVE